MDNISKYIESGILELYVLGLTNPQETEEVNELIKIYPEISNEINAISEGLLLYSEVNSPRPNSTIKAMVLASIDYSERLKSGEQPSVIPLLNDKSKVEDFSEWLKRDDMFLPKGADDIYAKLIGHTPQATSAIVWIKYATPPEIHNKEFEKFLIVEGTCDIKIDDKVYSLKSGDYLSIPLHVTHVLKVTSATPCKAILQRVAA
ncbi:MAG: cupin domain-containing protein [Bacteroidota bacterium]|nr:cupin domain-containing protein [Bacteroidota bacterium]